MHSSVSKPFLSIFTSFFSQIDFYPFLKIVELLLKIQLKLVFYHIEFLYEFGKDFNFVLVYSLYVTVMIGNRYTS